MPTKFLVIRFSSIGDIVLTTPVVRAIKTQLPNVEVHFCTKLAYKDLVINNPYIDKCHFLENSIFDLIAKLRAERFEFVIDLHNNLRTTLIKYALGVDAIGFSKLNVEKYLYTRFKINVLPRVHIVDRYMKTVKPFGVKNDGKGLDFFIPYKDQVESDWLPPTHQNGFVAYAIGGQHATKKLPLERMIELCQKINYPIVLLGGKEDAPQAQQIEGALGNALIYNACGKYNFNQSASLVEQSELVFSHDTGLMHVAAAFGKKIYSIWGSTTKDFGMYPYNTPYVILENNELDCRPCSKIGHDKCPQGHFNCMKALSFDFEIRELRNKSRTI